MDPAIAPIIGRSDRVDQHLDTARSARVDDRTEQTRRANAFAVVGDQDHVSPFQSRRQLGVQTGFDHRRDRVARLVVDADHLLRMPVLRPADVSFLESGRPVVQGDDPPVVDLVFAQHPAHQGGFGVVADSADQPHLRLQRPQHGRHARRAAEPMLALVGAQERNRSFLADPFGIAPDVAVENQVAHDHDTRTAQAFHAPNQVMRHRRGSPLSLGFAETHRNDSTLRQGPRIPTDPAATTRSCRSPAHFVSVTSYMAESSQVGHCTPGDWHGGPLRPGLCWDTDAPVAWLPNLRSSGMTTKPHAIRR